LEAPHWAAAAAYIDKTAKVPPSLVETVREHALPLSNGLSAFASLVDMAANASFVLIGEATHGTHEFYELRAQLTRRLIEEHGFNAVVVEANWPDTARVNKYVRGEGQDKSADEALSGYKEFPNWMWRNTDVRDFVSWLRVWNTALPAGTARTGFYGMDLYSLFPSRDTVLAYLRDTEPCGSAIRGRTLSPPRKVFRSAGLWSGRRFGMEDLSGEGSEAAVRAHGSIGGSAPEIRQCARS
jgi:erythromycin esterase-like protein